ncbi:MAG: hypothetical protein NTZ72_18775 [Afipia sp.]|nr:hypothetical protein [Afipia sp.]
MNYTGPINANLSSASAVSLEGDQLTFNSHSQGGGHSATSGIVIPDKHLLFTGDYTREGNDLILSGPDQKYVVHDYFKGEKRPALISEDGAMLSGKIVSSITGYVQYAQATPLDAAQVIGHVMKLTGSASVIRNGVTIELNIGDAVQKGDVVQTGTDTTIAMTLIDGSAFGMTSNARMVLNEMVYDPNGSSNSAFISLVQGTVTCVAGQTAKNGNMRRNIAGCGARRPCRRSRVLRQHDRRSNRNNDASRSRHGLFAIRTRSAGDGNGISEVTGSGGIR